MADIKQSTKCRAPLVREPRLRVSLTRDLMDFMRARSNRGTTEAEHADFAARFERVRDRVTDHLRHIVKIYGWPTVSMAGEAGATAAFFIAYYADHDLAFQKRCLTLMREASAGDVTPSSIAKLTDRILVGEGKAQIYGTQLITAANGTLSPAPIEDEALVDERRARIGLKPLAEEIAWQLSLRQ